MIIKKLLNDGIKNIWNFNLFIGLIGFIVIIL